MYEYDLTWLSVFASNTCKIDTNMQNLKIFQQASWEELEMFMVPLLLSLTKPKTRSSKHPRTKLVFLLRGALIHIFPKFSILVIQSQSMQVGSVCLFVGLFGAGLPENFTFPSPRQSGQRVCNFRWLYLKPNPFTIGTAHCYANFSIRDLWTSVSRRITKLIFFFFEKEGSLSQTDLYTQDTTQHPNFLLIRGFFSALQ